MDTITSADADADPASNRCTNTDAIMNIEANTNGDAGDRMDTYTKTTAGA